MYREFWEAGYHVFGLHGVTPDGKCKCGRDNCEAILKHPLASNWQWSPVWSEEQLETMEETGQFATGWGLVLRGLLAVDVDARRGGIASLEKLTEAVPGVLGAGFMQYTGSGGGSRHLLFRVPENVSLLSSLKDYPGIDFKSGSAFIVGPGSLHKSGNRYEVAYGEPSDIDMVPDDLLNILKRPDMHRADLSGQTVDVTEDNLRDMLEHIKNDDLDYDTWIKIGMALHHSSGGTAYALWDAWSQTSSKYDETEMPNKWHSFGKSANPVTLGTLVHYAEEGGWKQPVTFTSEVQFDFTIDEPRNTIDTKGVDILRPPGIVGQIASWVETRGRRKREHLAAIAALMIVANLAGLRYTDNRDRTVTNLMVFGVSGSATGKEAILDAITEIMMDCGCGGATHGFIKSEQELIRNLIEHQASFYLIDEVSHFLSKVKNAQSKGGTPYLEAILGTIMSIYSKGDGVFPVSGDLKRENKKIIGAQIAAINKKMDDEGENDFDNAKLQSLTKQLQNFDNGLYKPFLSLLGFTTPKKFDDLMDFDSATNGFIGRSILIREIEEAPRTKDDWVKVPLPENLMMTLRAIATGGSFDNTKMVDRIEFTGERKLIPTTADAREMLKKVITIFDDMAEVCTETNDLQALPMRGYEQVAKISLILAIPGGVREVEHVRWAYELIRRDVEAKINLVTANDKVKEAPADALRAKIMSIIGFEENGLTTGIIVNKAGRSFKKANVENFLKKMTDEGTLEAIETVHKFRKIKVVRYRRRKEGS